MSDLEATARKAVEAALGAGASDAEAWVEEAVTRQIRVYEGNVESLTDAGSRGVGLRVFLDGQLGRALDVHSAVFRAGGCVRHPSRPR